MNTYKEKLRIRTNLVALAAAITALIYVVLLLNRDHLPVLPSFIKGFHTGAFLGLEVFAAFYLGKYLKARNDEHALKKMYIDENDERFGLIIRNASTLGMSIILIGLCIAAIISGFFSATVFFALLGCLLFILVVFFSLWIYYSKKL